MRDSEGSGTTNANGMENEQTAAQVLLVIALSSGDNNNNESREGAADSPSS